MSWPTAPRQSSARWLINDSPRRPSGTGLSDELGQGIAQRLARNGENTAEWPIQIHDDVDRRRDRHAAERNRDIGEQIARSAQSKAGENHCEPKHQNQVEWCRERTTRILDQPPAQLH